MDNMSTPLTLSISDSFFRFYRIVTVFVCLFVFSVQNVVLVYRGLKHKNYDLVFVRQQRVKSEGTKPRERGGGMKVSNETPLISIYNVS